MADQNRETPAPNGLGEDVLNTSAADAAQAADGVQSDASVDVAALQSELEELRDRYLRQAAEYQNFRKRTAQERDSIIELGKVFVIERMLDLMDDLDRTLGAVDDAERQQDATAAYQGLKQGVELVHRRFVDELAKLNVEAIEAVGNPFDENLHDAMMQQPASQDTPPGTVVGEIQKGYRMGDRILRHSKVIVATEASA